MVWQLQFSQARNWNRAILVDLMAKIRFDNSFVSGVEEGPGTRFVINLNVPPLQLDDDDLHEVEGKESHDIASIDAAARGRPHPC